MNVYELAKSYYPRLWGKDRLEALVSAGRLTREEADQIMLPNGNTDREEGDTMVQRKEMDG